VRISGGEETVPLYEYRCSGCGSRFEVLRRMGQGTAGLSCPQCGGEEVEKEFSTFAGASGGSGDSGAGACSPSGRFT
jgi:putative FmdB family regulatory protein